MTHPRFSHTSSLILFLLTLAILRAAPAGAQSETVVHSFRANSVLDGSNPIGGLVADREGALYGTSSAGGKYGAGTVYKLAPPAVEGGAWTQNILYAFVGTFGGARDGSGPSGGLYISTRAGKIYGTTQAGGQFGQGTVYQLSPPTVTGAPWTETVLYNFASAGDGAEPLNGVVADNGGKLYGTTNNGGRYGVGTVFRISPPALSGGAWTEAILHSFNSTGTFQQGHPTGVILDATGSLYGATSYAGQSVEGVVFQLSPPTGGKGAWVENVLYTFTGAGGDGIIPAGNLVFGTNGTLFGTTLLGGQNGNGTVYELTPPTQGGVWTESVIYSFSPGAGDGANPVAALVLDGAGAVYGVTQSGGVESCGNASNGCGTAFKLVPPSTGGGAWTEEILHAFLGSGDGDVPQASLAIVGNTVYGTTMLGGTGFCNGTGGQLGCGTVFQVSQ